MGRGQSLGATGELLTLSTLRASGHVCLVGTRPRASPTEELDFSFILIRFDVKTEA